MIYQFTSFFAVREISSSIVEVHGVGVDGPPLDDLRKTIESTLTSRYGDNFRIIELGNNGSATGLRVAAGEAFMKRLAVDVCPHLRSILGQCVRALFAGADIVKGPLD